MTTKDGAYAPSFREIDAFGIDFHVWISGVKPLRGFHPGGIKKMTYIEKQEEREINLRIVSDIRTYGADVINSALFRKAFRQKHHTNSTVGEHTLNVTAAAIFWNGRVFSLICARSRSARYAMISASSAVMKSS